MKTNTSQLMTSCALVFRENKLYKYYTQYVGKAKLQAISIKYYIPCGFNRGLSFPVSFLKEEKNGCISTITKTVIDTEIWEWSMFGT
jgi:hypothetical protein